MVVSCAACRQRACRRLHPPITAGPQTVVMTEPIQLVWFKRDLRAHDHAPLALARHGSRRRKLGGAAQPAVRQDELFPANLA